MTATRPPPTKNAMRLPSRRNRQSEIAPPRGPLRPLSAVGASAPDGDVADDGNDGADSDGTVVMEPEPEPIKRPPVLPVGVTYDSTRGVHVFAFVACCLCPWFDCCTRGVVSMDPPESARSPSGRTLTYTSTYVCCRIECCEAYTHEAPLSSVDAAAVEVGDGGGEVWLRSSSSAYEGESGFDVMVYGPSRAGFDSAPPLSLAREQAAAWQAYLNAPMQ